jgi:glycosyltransferase involved in cell wall biosynthesis
MNRSVTAHSSGPRAAAADMARRPSIFFFCNVGWYFISHRLALAKAAKARGYDVHVACDIESPVEAETLRAAGLTFHRVRLSRGGSNPLVDLWTFLRCLGLLLKHRPTLTHNISIKPIVYAGVAARIARVRGIINAVSGLGYLFVDPNRAGLGRVIAQLLYRFSLRSRAVKAIFQNVDDQRYFVRTGLVRDAQTVLIAGSGVDLAAFSPAPEPVEGPIRIVLPARMLRDKGVGEFAVAAMSLQKAGLPVECLLAGGLDPGNPAAFSASDMERLQALGVVKWLGQVSDMSALLASCHIVCLPSYREGLPKALLEACAAGRPIVTTDVPGCRDVVREGINGLLVPTRDAKALYVALASLVNNRGLRVAMGARGRAIAVREYSLEYVVERTMRLYDELAGFGVGEAKVPARRKRLLLIVNDAGFFISHRLPVALAARRAGFEVHVATAHGQAAAFIRSHDITYHPLRLSRDSLNPLREIVAFVGITRLLRKLQPDLVHLVTVKPVLYGGLAARLTGVPGVVAAISGLGNVFAERNIWARGVRYVVTVAYRVALNRAGLKVIFQNPSDQDVLIRLAAVVRDRTVLVRGSGVDLQRFRPSPEPSGIPVVTFASRLLRSKGVCEFVAAAEQLRADGVQARFQIVGELDPQSPTSVGADEVERWRRGGAVEVTGQRQDMPEVFAASNLIVLPSYYGEGLPKVLAEAAACGRAVITTDWPGCRDAVESGHTGLLVPPRDVPGLAAAIRTLLDDPARRRSMGIAARALAERDYAIEHIVSQHLEVYRSVLPALPETPRPGMIPT